MAWNPTNKQLMNMTPAHLRTYSGGGGMAKPKKKAAKKPVQKSAKAKRLPTPKHFICGHGKATEPSAAEDRIRAILNGYEFEHLTEVSFKGFSTPKNQPYRFDFYIPYFKMVIEYDGADHRDPERKAVDKIKDAFCRQHRIYIRRFNSKHWVDLETHISKLILEQICRKNRLGTKKAA